MKENIGIIIGIILIIAISAVWLMQLFKYNTAIY
jgi:hypothetical protein